MDTPEPIVLGAVLYDPKVPRIWALIGDFLAQRGVPIEPVYFMRYERQVLAVERGLVDVAWNSPLAHVDLARRVQGACRAIAMRDTDCDRVSHLVVGKASGITRVDHLRGRTIGLGASDSPQATLLPQRLLARAGLVGGRDVVVRRFDRLVGLHGDHVGGEREAFAALAAGEVDACAMIDLNWQAWTASGEIDPARFAILATTDPYDHCVFSVRADFPAEAERRFVDALLAMDYANPAHREMMDLEGLKAWRRGRVSGLAALTEATHAQGFFGRS